MSDHTKLHRSSPIELTVCGCGNLHLTYRAVTLHFSREEFMLFAAAVQHVANKLTAPGKEFSTPSRSRCH